MANPLVCKNHSIYWPNENFQRFFGQFPESVPNITVNTILFWADCLCHLSKYVLAIFEKNLNCIISFFNILRKNCKSPWSFSILRLRYLFSIIFYIILFSTILNKLFLLQKRIVFIYRTGLGKFLEDIYAYIYTGFGNNAVNRPGPTVTLTKRLYLANYCI